MRARVTAGEAAAQLTLFSSPRPAPAAPPPERVSEPPAPALSIAAAEGPASEPTQAPPLPARRLPPDREDGDELEEPDVIADRIITNLREAIDALESVQRALRGEPEPDAPGPDADFCTRLMHEMKVQTRRVEQDNARLDAFLAELSPETRAAAQAAAAPRKSPPRMGRGKRGAEVRGDDGITHRELTERQRELVRGLRVDAEDRVFGPEGHIPDWPALKIVVEVLGGRWLPGGRGKAGAKRQGHWTFPEDIDPRDVLRLAGDTGRILDPQSNDLYETSDELADELVQLLELRPGMRVLEPSGGKGALARAIRRACPSAEILCVELLAENVAALEAQGFRVMRSDFLALRVGSMPPFDAVAMNPPFTRFAYARHIAHALDFTRIGGRLAAIASGALMSRTMGPVGPLRERLALYDAVYRDLGFGAFSASGTEIRTCLVHCTRTV